MSKKIKAVICIAALAVSFFTMVGCEEVEVMFDAPSLYYEKDGYDVSYTGKMLKEKFGEPNETDSWTYENIFGEQYKMKTYYYDDFECLLHNGHLLRVTFNNVNTDGMSATDVMAMFNLKKYSNTNMEDNNVSFRASPTDVYEIWAINYDSDDTTVKLTYWNFPW